MRLVERDLGSSAGVKRIDPTKLGLDCKVMRMDMILVPVNDAHQENPTGLLDGLPLMLHCRREQSDAFLSKFGIGQSIHRERGK